MSTAALNHDEARSTTAAPILSVRDVTVSVRGKTKPRTTLVRGVSFDVRAGETLGVVGESGSGKSVTMLALLGLLPSHTLKVEGVAELKGTDLLSSSERTLRRVRGGVAGMIFQDPMTSLDPVFTLGAQISEMIRLHDATVSRQQAWDRSVELLRLVGVGNPEGRAKQYPHEFSGGMRQRAMIAMAIANNPEVLIADEPTTALDVTIQAQVMDVLKTAQRAVHAAVVLISHDLGLIAENTDRVAVMYAGNLVETGPTAEVIEGPRHPYTKALLECLPHPEGDKHELQTIPGQPPDPSTDLPGCRFVDRCPLSRGRSICHDTPPPLAKLAPGRASACHFSDELNPEASR